MIYAKTESGWTSQRGGLILRKKAIETGRKVALFVYRSFLKKVGIDGREIIGGKCPLCGGIS